MMSGCGVLTEHPHSLRRVEPCPTPLASAHPTRARAVTRRRNPGTAFITKSEHSKQGWHAATAPIAE